MMNRYEVHLIPRDRKRGGIWNADVTAQLSAASEADARQQAFVWMPDLRGHYAIKGVRLLEAAQ